MIVALRKATSQYWIRLALIRDFYTKFEPPLASRSNDDSSILYPGDKHISYYKRFGYNFGIVWRIIAMNAFVALLSGGFGWFCSKENIVSWIILGLFVCVAFGQILVVPMQYRARLQNAEYDFRAQMNL